MSASCRLPPRPPFSSKNDDYLLPKTETPFSNPEIVIQRSLLPSPQTPDMRSTALIVLAAVYSAAAVPVIPSQFYAEIHGTTTSTVPQVPSGACAL